MGVHVICHQDDFFSVRIKAFKSNCDKVKFVYNNKTASVTTRLNVSTVIAIQKIPELPIAIFVIQQKK